MRGAVVAVLLLALLGCDPGPEPSTDPTTTTPASPSCEGTGTGTGTGTPVTTRDIAYTRAPGVDPRLLSLDLTVPGRGGRCRPAPVVVWVHGGAFAIGDKANGVADMVRWATAQGWAFASVNHRLSPRPSSGHPGTAPSSGSDPDRVLHPTHVGDVADAVGWLVDHAAERRLDPDRVLLLGHSAGAFLVALLATDPSHLAGAGVDLGRIRAVAALDTRYDIAAEIAAGDPDAEAMYRNAFGDDPDVWRDASPLTHAGSSGSEPPFVVVTRGRSDRMDAARAFADALDEATLVDARPLTHQQVGDALGRTGEDVVTPAVTEVFRRAVDRPAATPR